MGAGRATAVGYVVGIAGGMVLVLVLVIFIVPWARRRAKERRTVLKDVEQASSSLVAASPSPYTPTFLITSKQADNDARENSGEKATSGRGLIHGSQMFPKRTSYERDSVTKSLDRSSAWDQTSTMSGESGLSNVRLVTPNEVRRQPLQLAVARSMEELTRTSADSSPIQTPSFPSPPISYPPKSLSERIVGSRPKAGLPRSPMEPLIERRESSQSGLSNPTDTFTRPPSQVPSHPNPALLAPFHNPPDLHLISTTSTVPSHHLTSAFEGSISTGNPSVSSNSKATDCSHSLSASLFTNESAVQSASTASETFNPLQTMSSPRSSSGTTDATSPPITAKHLALRPESDGQVQIAGVLRSSEPIQMFLQAHDHQAIAPHVLAIPTPPPYPPPTTPLPPTPRDDDASLKARLLSHGLRPSPSLLMVSEPGQVHLPMRSQSDCGARQSLLRPVSLALADQPQEPVNSNIGDPPMPSSVAASSVNVLPQSQPVEEREVYGYPLSDVHDDERSVSSSDHDSAKSMGLPAPLPLHTSTDTSGSHRPLSSPPSRRPSGPRRPLKRGRDAPFPVAARSPDSLPASKMQPVTLPAYSSGIEGSNTLSIVAEMETPADSSPPDVDDIDPTLSPPPPRIPSFPPMTPLTLRSIMVSLEHEPMPELRLDDGQSEAHSTLNSMKGVVLPSISTLSTLSLGRASPDRYPLCEVETEAVREDRPNSPMACERESPPALLLGPDARRQSQAVLETDIVKESRLDSPVAREQESPPVWPSIPETRRRYQLVSETDTAEESSLDSPVACEQESLSVLLPRPEAKRQFQLMAETDAVEENRLDLSVAREQESLSVLLPRPETKRRSQLMVEIDTIEENRLDSPVAREQESLPVLLPRPDAKELFQLVLETDTIEENRPDSPVAREQESLPILEPPSRRESKERPQLAIETSFLDAHLENIRLAWLRPPSPLRVAKRPRPVSDMTYPSPSL
ncbi:hypothetical protein NEOLEDRAFT_1171320 [Neolentinus lepideus HHB14362 ss-1]|uniref:Uncharacterized protein n=1 Tax=Neolentinus lepideus HHB14362 ss-1 TaxID=1314782 RepID=A0A165QHX3_9AGAM|nr:hypothetical protein NEOLEDRAFT_1171320 [Neolentinus lepideus HHB14362 ss-1]